MHAQFSLRSDRWYLIDQGATNGTFVGGVRIQKDRPTELLNGMSIGFGPAQFTFYDAEQFYEHLDGLNEVLVGVNRLGDWENKR